ASNPRVQKAIMEIFNIHPLELLLIAGLALVVFGPERLPELGRLAGKQVARFLAWQQQSPELKLVNEMRAEFDQQITTLRDELVRTRRQLDTAHADQLTSLREDLRPMLDLRDEVKRAVANGSSGLTNPAPPTPTPLPPTSVEVTPAPPVSALAPAEASPSPRTPPTLSVRPAAGTVQAASRLDQLAPIAPDPPLDQPVALSTNGHSLTPISPASPPSAATHLMLQQIERLNADLQALISALQAQGQLSADWQPEAVKRQQEISSS
ncbi:MAG: twin-arginine translocase TatA/TatE family subunit, partial [Chloroflexales bacterium]